MENNNVWKKGFIKKCEEYRVEGIFSTEYATEYILNNICNDSYCGDYEFDNEMFKAVTHKKILDIIEVGVQHLFNPDQDEDCYLLIAEFRSGLQFLVDYAESHEDINCDVKKRLQKIIKNNVVETMTKKLYEKINNYPDNYLDNCYLGLKNIPKSHYWWKRC